MELISADCAKFSKENIDYFKWWFHFKVNPYSIRDFEKFASKALNENVFRTILTEPTYILVLQEKKPSTYKQQISNILQKIVCEKYKRAKALTYCTDLESAKHSLNKKISNLLQENLQTMFFIIANKEFEDVIKKTFEKLRGYVNSFVTYETG